MSTLPLGVSSWCFHHHLSKELLKVISVGEPCPPELMPDVVAYYTEVADVILDSDVKAVEVWYTPILRSEPVMEQLTRLADAGRVASMHTMFSARQDVSLLDENGRNETVREYCDAADILGKLHGRALIVHSSHLVEDPSEMPDRIRQTVKSVREIADFAVDRGVHIAVEVLPPVSCVGNGGPQVLSILETVDRPNVGTCIDMNHIFPPDQLPPTIRLLGPRILTTHISDYDGVEERHWLPTEGVIDWTAAINALRAANYTGPFMYESRTGGSSIREVVSIATRNYETLMQAAAEAS